MNNTQIKIAPTLKKLNLYDSAEFELTRYTSVNACIQRIQTEKSLRFTQKMNKVNAVVKVTRIA